MRRIDCAGGKINNLLFIKDSRTIQIVENMRGRMKRIRDVLHPTIQDIMQHASYANEESRVH